MHTKCTEEVHHAASTGAPKEVQSTRVRNENRGSFKFLGDDRVQNEAGNAGLFRGMDSQGLPTSGPIAYDALASRIQSLIAN